MRLSTPMFLATLLTSQLCSAIAMQKRNVRSTVAHARSAVPNQSVEMDAGGQILQKSRQRSRPNHALLEIARQVEVGKCSEGLRSMMKDLRARGVAAPGNGGAGQDIEGGSNNAEVDYLAQLATEELTRLNKPPGSGRICQTGFNFGNSAFAFLCSTSAKVSSWDLGEHSYVKPAEEMLEKLFPGRHSLAIGDSTKTLPMAGDMAGQCDLVFVDGGHTKEVATADIGNFAKLAAPGALIIVDDCQEKAQRTNMQQDTPWYVAGVDIAFQSAESAGKLYEDVDKEQGLQKLTHERSVCVGRYPAEPGVLSKIISGVQNAIRSASVGKSNVQMMQDTEMPTISGGKPASMVDVSATATSGDPCSYLGCNSHKCAWASGGVITRLVAKKSCSNAVALGNGDGAAGAQGTTMLKISTLKECMNAVKSLSGSSCSGHFQLHKDSMTCSCVPTGGVCSETDDENVCRYQVMEH